MNGSRVSQESDEAHTFRRAYRACVEENRGRPERSSFYVKWAQDFAGFMPRRRLREGPARDLEAFPAQSGQREGIADWQLRQA